jgi:hypothetical protein
MRFEMVEHPWNGTVIIFNDGYAKLYSHRLDVDRPVLVQVEGLKPTTDQIYVCRRLWMALNSSLKNYLRRTDGFGL